MRKFRVNSLPIIRSKITIWYTTNRILIKTKNPSTLVETKKKEQMNSTILLKVAQVKTKLNTIKL